MIDNFLLTWLRVVGLILLTSISIAFALGLYFGITDWIKNIKRKKLERLNDDT